MLFRTLILSSRRKHSDFKETVETMSKRFSDLINYCESTKFRGFECPKRYWEMSSLDETKGRRARNETLQLKGDFLPFSKQQSQPLSYKKSFSLNVRSVQCFAASLRKGAQLMSP